MNSSLHTLERSSPSGGRTRTLPLTFWRSTEGLCLNSLLQSIHVARHEGQPVIKFIGGTKPLQGEVWTWRHARCPPEPLKAQGIISPIRWSFTARFFFFIFSYSWSVFIWIQNLIHVWFSTKNVFKYISWLHINSLFFFFLDILMLGWQTCKQTNRRGRVMTENLIALLATEMQATENTSSEHAVSAFVYWRLVGENKQTKRNEKGVQKHVLNACLPLPRPRCSRLSALAHFFTLLFLYARVNHNFHSFIPCTGKLGKNLPSFGFPPAYGLPLSRGE